MYKLKPFKKCYRILYLTFQTLLLLPLLWGASPIAVSASSAFQEEPSPTLVCEPGYEGAICDAETTKPPVITPLPPACPEGMHLVEVPSDSKTQTVETVWACEDDSEKARIPMGG